MTKYHTHASIPPHMSFQSTQKHSFESHQEGNLPTWPTLTYANVSKHLPDMPVTALRHLDQARQGLQLTKPLTLINDDDLTLPPLSTATNQVIAQVILFQQNNKGHFDLMGAFPYTSSRGIVTFWFYMHNMI